MQDVAKQKKFRVNWRLISLTLLNVSKNYDEDFPPNYEVLHGKGLAMLRVALAVRQKFGPEPLDNLYTAYGESIWNRTFPDSDSRVEGVMKEIASPQHLVAALEKAGLPAEFAEAASDSSLDEELLAETQLALSRTGKDVGTPIISYQPPDGPSFFGPVISDQPKSEDALKLWDAVLALATWPSFAELKRTKRDKLNLPLLRNMDQ